MDINRFSASYSTPSLIPRRDGKASANILRHDHVINPMVNCVDQVCFGRTPVKRIEKDPRLLIPIDSTTDPRYKVQMTFVQSENCMLRKVYPDCAGIYLRPEPAAALQRVLENLGKQGLGLILYDGYRPFSIVQDLWDQTPIEKRGFVSPPDKARHSRGTAVDATLYDLKTGRILNMPSLYDEFSRRGHPDYKGGTEEERTNRQILIDAFAQQGFKPYRLNEHDGEWWHFDYQNWDRNPRIDTSFETLHWIHKIDNNPSVDNRAQALLDPDRKRDELFYQDLAIFLREKGDNLFLLNNFLELIRSSLDGCNDGYYRPVYEDTFHEMIDKLQPSLQRKLQIIIENSNEITWETSIRIRSGLPSVDVIFKNLLDQFEKYGCHPIWLIQAWAVDPEFFKSLNENLPGIPRSKIGDDIKSLRRIIKNADKELLRDILLIMDSQGEKRYYNSGLFYRRCSTEDLENLITASKNMDHMSMPEMTATEKYKILTPLAHFTSPIHEELRLRRLTKKQLREEINDILQSWPSEAKAYILRCLRTWDEDRRARLVQLIRK